MTDTEMTTDPKPKTWKERKDARRLVELEALEEFGRALSTFTELTARFAGTTAGAGAVNNVLEMGTFAIPAAGDVYQTFQWRVAAGCVEVANLSASDMTVTSAPPEAGGTAPATGHGTYVLPAGAVRVINVASRTVTVYGVASARFTFQASTVGGFVSSGIVGVNGGGV